jgi:hypothetical protein
VDRVTLRMLHTTVDELLRSLAGEDYCDGSDNPPQWFMEAAGMVEAPAGTALPPRKDFDLVEMVQQGLGLAR